MTKKRKIKKTSLVGLMGLDIRKKKENKKSKKKPNIKLNLAFPYEKSK